MELRINVSDEKFAELVNKEMDALSVDDLQEMIRALALHSIYFLN